MNSLSPMKPLGVELMDADHARLDRLFDAVAHAGDDMLAVLFEEMRDEIAAHFAREEAMMHACAVPVLPCHAEMHEKLLAQFDAGRRFVEADDFIGLRIHLGSAAPHLVAHHVETADTVAAGFITGDLSAFTCAG